MCVCSEGLNQSTATLSTQVNQCGSLDLKGTLNVERPVWWNAHSEEYIIHVAQSLGFAEIHTPKVGSVKGCAIFFYWNQTKV